MSEPQNPAPGNELGVLGRWSRRKRRFERGEPLEDEPAVEERAPRSAADAAPSDTPEPELTDADMPPIEAIDAQTDLAGFFSPKVSEALRRQALRRYFHLPGVHIADRMNEYDEDYRSFQPLGDLVPEERKRKLVHEAERLGRELLEGEDERGTGDAGPEGEAQAQAGIAGGAHDKGADDL